MLLYYLRFIHFVLRVIEEMTPAQELEKLFHQNDGIVQRYQVVEAGLRPELLSQWVEAGKAERIQRGIYRLQDFEVIEHETLIELSLKIPRGVVCLHSALSFHNLGTVIPSKIQIAIPNHSRTPKIDYPPVDFFYYSDKQYHYGIETHKFSGRNIKVHSQEKAIVDSFYQRNKLGKDVFLESLSDYLNSSQRSIQKLMEAAKVRRVFNTIRPYIEASV